MSTAPIKDLDFGVHTEPGSDQQTSTLIHCTGGVTVTKGSLLIYVCLNAVASVSGSHMQTWLSHRDGNAAQPQTPLRKVRIIDFETAREQRTRECRMYRYAPCRADERWQPSGAASRGHEAGPSHRQFAAVLYSFDTPRRCVPPPVPSVPCS